MIEIQTESTQSEEKYICMQEECHTHTYTHTARWNSMQSMSCQTPPACQEDVWMQHPTTKTQTRTQTHSCKDAHCLQNNTTFFLSLSRTHTHTHLIAILSKFIPLPSRCGMQRGEVQASVLFPSLTPSHHLIPAPLFLLSPSFLSPLFSIYFHTSHL